MSEAVAGTANVVANPQSDTPEGQSGIAHRGSGTWFPAASRAVVETHTRYDCPGTNATPGCPTSSSVADESHRCVRPVTHAPPTWQIETAGLVAVMFIALLNSRVTGWSSRTSFAPDGGSHPSTCGTVASTVVPIWKTHDDPVTTFPPRSVAPLLSPTRYHPPGISNWPGETSISVFCAVHWKVSGTGVPGLVQPRPSRQFRSVYAGSTVVGRIGRSNWIASVVFVGIPVAFGGGHVTSSPGVDGSGRTETSTEFAGTSTIVPESSSYRSARTT